MAQDAELVRLIAEKARVQASIDQIEADNTVQGSFADVNIRRNEIKELEDQRNRINVRIQRRKGQVLNLRDPVWGSVIRATRQPPDGLDTQLGDYTIDEADLEPADGGTTPETVLVPSHPVHVGTHRRYLGVVRRRHHRGDRFHHGRRFHHRRAHHPRPHGQRTPVVRG